MLSNCHLPSPITLAYQCHNLHHVLPLMPGSFQVLKQIWILWTLKCVVVALQSGQRAGECHPPHWWLHCAVWILWQTEVLLAFLYFPVVLTYIHILTMTSWRVECTSLPFHFCLEYMTCSGQWNVSRQDMNRGFKSACAFGFVPVHLLSSWPPTLGSLVPSMSDKENSHLRWPMGSPHQPVESCEWE